MSTTMDAICEHGTLVLPWSSSLPEKSCVASESEDTLRENWLKPFEAFPLKTWGHNAAAVFNELLKK